MVPPQLVVVPSDESLGVAVHPVAQVIVIHTPLKQVAKSPPIQATSLSLQDDLVVRDA